MPRETTIPAKTVTEEIQAIQETMATPNSPGSVTVMVGLVDEAGAFIVPQQIQVYRVTGADFEELTGPATTWAPDKPAGTYRNADLWHFIDLQRAQA